jgi:hypothetical protein
MKPRLSQACIEEIKRLDRLKGPLAPSDGVIADCLFAREFTDKLLDDETIRAYRDQAEEAR